MYGTTTKKLFNDIQDIHVYWWKNNCKPLHCLTYPLNSKYYNMIASISSCYRFIQENIEKDISIHSRLYGGFQRVFHWQ